MDFVLGTYFVREQYTANVLSVPQTKTKSSKKCMKAKSGIFLVLTRVADKVTTNCAFGRWPMNTFRYCQIYRQTLFLIIKKFAFLSIGEYFLFHRRTLFVIEAMVRKDKWGILLKDRCPQWMCHNFVKTIWKSPEKWNVNAGTGDKGHASYQSVLYYTAKQSRPR